MRNLFPTLGRAIAEEMYSRNLLECDVEYQAVDGKKNPPHNSVTAPSDNVVYNYLGQYPQPDTAHVHRSLPEEVTAMYASDVVPSVIGFSATDAMYVLEKMGFKVEINGVGHVVHQSIEAGIPLQKGMNMKLTLK